jgi:hypothetical protein
MTNTLASPTMGFQSFRRTEGASPTGGLTEVWISSTDPGPIFRGDPVLTSTFGGTNNSGAYITSVATAGAAFLCRGVFQGCYQYQPSAQRVIWNNFYNGTVTGSTGDIKAYIIDDPEEQFLIQASTKGTILSSLIGLNIGITTGISTTGNTLSGYSNITVESTAATASSSFPFRIVDFYAAYAPGIAGFGSVNANTSVATPLVNGTDNGNVANMIIVRLNNCDRLSLTSRST